MELNELWKPVTDYEGIYEVSSRGRVRRVGGSFQCPTSRVISMKTSLSGYYTVDLSVKSKVRRHYVHRLVTMAFHGQPGAAKYVNHKDGNKLNNTPQNLEWVTNSQNLKHSYRTLGRQVRDMRGEKNPRAKLTIDQVREIRQLRGVFSTGQLGKRYGVTGTTIKNIFDGKLWPMEVK